MHIAIEGPSFSGKTTLCRRIASCDATAEQIPEYVEFAGGADRFPKFPPRDHAESQAAFDYFFDLEAERQLWIRQSTRAHCVLDRSLFTLAAFEYAAQPLTGIDGLPYAEARILAAREWWPDLVVVLHVSPSELENRARQPMGRMPHFVSRGFNERIYQYLDGLHARFGVAVQICRRGEEIETIAALLATT